MSADLPLVDRDRPLTGRRGSRSAAVQDAVNACVEGSRFMAKEHKYVYTFGAGKAEGDASMRNLLGGKGANLAEMCNIGLPVPAGFTITTDVCTYYYANDHSYPKELKKQVEAALKHVEKIMGAEFGSAKNPLLVSCRSGARESMPGMMDK